MSPTRKEKMATIPSRIDLLELDIDLRLSDLWREADEITEWNLEDPNPGEYTAVLDGMVRQAPGDAGVMEEDRLDCEPALVLHVGRRIQAGRFRAWLRRHRIRTLNVAGPRESKRPGIQREAAALLRRLLSP